MYSASTRSTSKALRYSTHCQGITQFYMHTLRFIRKRNELYLPSPCKPQLILIYRPQSHLRKDVNETLTYLISLDPHGYATTLRHPSLNLVSLLHASCRRTSIVRSQGVGMKLPRLCHRDRDATTPNYHTVTATSFFSHKY